MISKGYEVSQIGLFEKNEREHLKSLIRSEYERCHPDETLEDLERRSRFSKEDKGLLRDWMALAMQRAITSRDGRPVIDLNMAA